MAAAEPIDIPYADFKAIEKDLDATIMGDGTTPDGHRFWIRRYVSRVTGKVYDCSFTPGVDTEPRCAEIPDAART